MIVPKLWARLGNQCFMIAAAIAHAKKMQTNWCCPTHTLAPSVWPIYFNDVPKTSIVPRQHYKEKRHCFDPIPEHSDLQIEGYFQSEKYFADAKPEVQMALNFFVQPDDIVAVHVRRGDYLEYPDHHPVLTEQYYDQAIMEMITKGFSRFAIYSDDIDYCKTIFNVDYYNGLDIGYSYQKNPLHAMRDMYNAAAFIISNSTFSLFPAILRADNPVVIAPAEHRWYGPKNLHLQTHDLMPDRFIKI